MSFALHFAALHIYIYTYMVIHYVYVSLYLYVPDKAACCQNIEIALHPTTLSFTYIYTYIYIHTI